MNASVCDRSNAPTVLNWDARDRNLAMQGMAWSYEACGNLDSYSPNRYYDSLAGKTLRISYPGDSSSGYTIVTGADGSKDGSVVAFVEQIAREVGFSTEVRPVSAASRSRFASSFTACVHEVALNATDLCVGNFWVTTERLLLAPFSSSIYQDEFVLIVRAHKQDDRNDLEKLQHMLFIPFRSFTGGAWGWIAVTIVYYAVVMHAVDPRSYAHALENEEMEASQGANSHKDDPSRVDHNGTSVAAHAQTFLRHERHQYSRAVHALEGRAARISASMYLGAVGFATGDPHHLSRTAPSRFASLGFVLFGVVVVQNYTASTAASLFILASGETSTHTLDDTVASGKPICTRQALVSNLVHRYPHIAEERYMTEQTEKLGHLSSAEVEDALLDSVDAGRCTAIVTMKDSWESARRRHPSEHCNKFVTATLFTETNAMPVRERYVEVVSYLIAKFKATGLYNDLREEYQTKYLHEKPHCFEEEEEEEDKSNDYASALGPYHLFGPLAVSWAASTIGLLYFYCCGYAHRTVAHSAYYRATLANRECLSELYSMSFSELYGKAKSLDTIEPGDLKLALDAAPNKKGLVKLIVEATPVPGSEMYLSFTARSIAELCKLAESANIPETTVNECLDHALGPKEALISALMDKLDTDGDGRISKQELDELDANGDGYISPSEVAAVTSPKGGSSTTFVSVNPVTG